MKSLIAGAGGFIGAAIVGEAGRASDHPQIPS